MLNLPIEIIIQFKYNYYRRRYYEKIISTVLAFAIMGTMSTDVLAYSNESYYSVPSMIQYTIENDNMGDIVNRHQLLNQENEQVATCLDCENGYIIYDVNDCIIEYSPTAESPYANYDDIVYYGGPLEYVTEEMVSSLISLLVIMSVILILSQ